jgi:hypothetical protein
VATKKQQRRRYARAKAHGRGDDLIEEDGERIERRPAPAKKAQTRSGKVPKPPDAKRVAQRSVLFAALFFLLQHFTSLGSKSSPLAQVLFAVWMFAMFFVIGMWTERYAWRRYLKQTGQGGT